MFDLRAIRENPEAFRKAWNRRKPGLGDVVNAILEADDKRIAAQQARDLAASERKQKSNEIGQAMKAGNSELAESLKEDVAVAKAVMEKAEQTEKEAEEERDQILYGLPNIPLDEVPEGSDEHGNIEQHRWGEPKRINAPKDHADLGEALGMMDFETAAKMSGARFVLLKGKLARLERALAAFMLDLQTDEHGYTECSPPLLVKDDALKGTGQLPKFAEDLFFTDPRRPDFEDRMRRMIVSVASGTIGPVPSDVTITGERLKEIVSTAADNAGKVYSLREWDETFDWFDGKVVERRFGLIPTAEVPLTNIVRDSIIEPGELPYRFTAHTPCFRSEAGSAGRDTKGMIRLHQFNKVELVSIVANQEEGLKELERMTTCAEEVLKRLDLPFRRMLLCTGDMGAGARKTYDLEVWLPSQNTYREISSCSYCGDYQAMRMKARYRPEAGAKPEFVHTLNGSDLAVGRTLVAVVENYQNEDGSITIPEALRPYMGGLEVIK